MAIVEHEKAATVIAYVGDDRENLADVLEHAAAWIREHGDGKVIFGGFRVAHPCRWIIDIVMSEHAHA